MSKQKFLQLNNVGRSKFNKKVLLHPEISTPDEITEAAYLHAHPHLRSNIVNYYYNPTNNKGSIYSGFGRLVGTFHIVSTC